MIIYSKQVFFYILEKHSHLINTAYLAKEVDKKTFSKIKNHYKGEIVKLDNKKAQAMAKGNNHQGFFLDIQEQYFTPFSDINLKECKFVLLLSEVTDVGNIGAIIRTAYCMGVDALIITGINNIPLQHIIRTSAGAFFDIPVVCFKDTLDILSRLKEQGFSIYGASLDGEDLDKINFLEKKALIVGSEGFGLSNKVIKKLDYKITIKMVNEFDSLNVSSASAILLNSMK